MFHTILVPYDGSALAQLALPNAKAMARASGAELVLVYGLAPWESPLDVPRALYEAAAQARRDGLAAQTTYVPARLGAQGAGIVEYAEAIGADLIVLGTHAYGVAGRTLFGSVADDVVRHTMVPVLCCTDKSASAWGEGRPSAVLLPLDGSLLAETAVTTAIAFARTFAAPLTLLRVRSPDVTSNERAVDAATSAAESAADYLATVAEALRRQGHAVETRVGVGEPGAVIAEAARALGAGVIVLATHGRGGLPRVLLGSTALNIVQQSVLPVVLVRPLRMRVVFEPAAVSLAATVGPDGAPVRSGSTATSEGTPPR